MPTLNLPSLIVEEIEMELLSASCGISWLRHENLKWWPECEYALTQDDSSCWNTLVATVFLVMLEASED